MINEEENLRLAIYLKSLPKPLDIMSMKDHRNFTLLNYAAYKNVASCFKIIYEYALKFNIDKTLDLDEKLKIIAKWVNSKADDNFTALHFAAKHGNYIMLKVLVDDAGADLMIENQYGANVMHIAAQYD